MTPDGLPGRIRRGASSLARLALTVIDNHTGGVPRPSYITYLVSYRCNAKCGMCDSWRMRPGAELSPNEAGLIFAKLAPLDAVRLTGGEPFLRPDFAELADAVFRAASPLLLHITTNGSFPDEACALARDFPSPGRLWFMVSLDGFEETHDRNRGRKVTYARALETVRRLAELRGSGVRVSVNHTVISERSLQDAQRIRDALTELDIDVQTVLAYAESSMYSLANRGKKATHAIVPRGYPLHPDLEGVDAIDFVERELERTGTLRSAGMQLGKRYYLEGLLARLRNDETPSPHPRCVALRSHLRLLPDGRVPVCQFNTETVGSLLDTPLEQLWHSPATREARDWVDACPGCWAECEVVPSAIYTGDLLNPLNGLL
jgi:MoaA/NifB/PqqE/SkfB family radical SAM enzyme